MNIIFTVFIFIYSAIAFAQEQQQLNSAKVKTKTEYIYQFNKNGEIEEQGRFLSKTLYNKKGQTIEDSVVWTEGIWRRGKTTYNEQGKVLTYSNTTNKENGSIETNIILYSYTGDSIIKTYDKWGTLKSHEVKVNDSLRKFYDQHGGLIYTVTQKENIVNEDVIFSCRKLTTIGQQGIEYNNTIYYMNKEGKAIKKEIDNNRIEVYLYDDKGRRTETIETTIKNKAIGKTTYKYNKRGLPSEIISYNDKGKPIDKIEYFYKYFK